MDNYSKWMIIGLQWALVQIMRTVSRPFCCFKFANFRWFRVICHPNAPVAAGTRLTERLLEPTYLPSLVATTVWLQSPCSHPALTLRSPYSAGAQNEAFWWWNLDNHGSSMMEPMHCLVDPLKIFDEEQWINDRLWINGNLPIYTWLHSLSDL